MAHSYHQPQTAMRALFDSFQQDSTAAYSLFGPTQYPESVAFWHDPPAAPPAMAVPAYPSTHKQSTLLQPITDQKKHKRTRSGCFTCRSRRIKCDEGRPICERCRKGSRDCVYPSATTSSSKSGPRSSAKSRGPRPPSRGSESSGKADPEESSPLEPIPDEETEGAESGTRPSPSSSTAKSRRSLQKSRSTQSLRKRSAKHTADSSPLQHDQGSSPSTESSRYESTSARSASVSHTTLDPLSNVRLPDDLRFYLDFHQDVMTHQHYFLRQSSTRFIHQSMIELALQYEPLLYALVGFAAYHHTLHTAGGKLYTFLKYYNKALVLLRKSLGSGEAHNEATLITVLVLTTFEVSILS